MKSRKHGTSHSVLQAETYRSGWRAEAKRRRSRMEASEAIFSTAFDILSGKDMLRFLLTLGAAEIGGGAEAGMVLAAPATGIPGTALAVPATALAGAIGGAMLAVTQFGIGMSLWVFMKAMSFFVRRLKRPIYYPKERQRRRMLAHERRCVRDRFTVNPCPSPEKLRDQYAKVKRNAREAVKFGSMLCDIEAYCDNSLIRNNDGEIIGRNAGVKGWLRLHCPELATHYKNAMRYKAMAEKFRQASGVGDPVPAAVLAEREPYEATALLGGDGRRIATVRNEKVGRRGRKFCREFELKADDIVAAWHRAQEIFAACEGRAADTEANVAKDEGTRSGGIADKKNRSRYGSMAGLEAIVARMLAPEFAPSGWRMDTKPPPRIMA